MAQTSKLPLRGFKWVEEKEFETLDWENMETEGDEGYVLEVDLKYPDYLHEYHGNLPLAPENVEVNYFNLSPTAKKLLEMSGGKKSYKDVKLMGTFYDREDYIIHFKLLKLYLQLGMKLKKVHRVIRFEQSEFIKPFIEKCTWNRQQSKTKFEQDQFKKLANSVYGKTIQNVRNYVRVKLHLNMDSLMNAASDSGFKNYNIISENLVQTNHKLERIEHKQPLFIGFAILELSKHFMFDFFYNKLMKNLKCNLKMGMTDTDSFLFYVDDKKEFRSHIAKYMDYSNYPSNHHLFSEENKAKLGYFKDELGGRLTCQEFVGLRSKCYAMKLVDIQDNRNDKKVCKGIGRVAIKNRLKFQHYKNCLFNKIQKRTDFCNISTKSHTIRTVRTRKKALSFFDSKRWIFDCEIHSTPYGSVEIRDNPDAACKECYK